MSDYVIQAENLSKIFRLYQSSADRLKEALHPFGRKYHQDFYALDSINLAVKKGHSIGIIGLNGSGKSTLLQIIAGVLTPSKGTMQVNGKIAALLELGAGFNPEFTGLENTIFQCSIMGYSKKEIDALLPQITDFAGIGDFIHHPVKTYSSGMYVRLAFSVAISVDPDILIVDEALAVGDVKFQSKCMARIREFRDGNKTLLFVSHDPGAVKSLCDTAYLLDEGHLVDHGDPDKVFNFYNSLIAEKDTRAIRSNQSKKAELRQRSGNKRLVIEHVRLIDDVNTEADTVISGRTVRIELQVKANQETMDPSFGVMIRDRLGNDIFGTNNQLMAKATGLLQAGQSYRITYEMPLNLGAGLYNITVAAHLGQTHLEDNFDWINEALAFRVVNLKGESFAGCCRLQPTFAIQPLLDAEHPLT